MKRLLIWVLFLAINPCHAQLLKLSGSISEKKKAIFIQIENISNKSVYVPNTFQNYFFFIRKGDADLKSASEIKEYWGSGIGIYLFDSIGDKVYSPMVHCPQCQMRVLYRPSLDSKSITYKIYGPRPHLFHNQGVTPAMVVNSINKSGFILKAGEVKQVRVNLPKSVFNSQSYAFTNTDMAYKPIKAVLQFANFVSRSELVDTQVGRCDTVFQGWVNGADSLSFNIEVIGKPRHISQHIIVGKR